MFEVQGNVGLDDRADALAEALIRPADHGHAGVVGDGVLCLDGRDVDRSSDDQVLDASGDRDVPVGVDAGQIAGAEEPVADEVLGVQFGLAEVAVEHSGSAHDQLAGAAILQPHPGVEDS